MPYQMLSPCGKDSLHFWGKNIIDFLTEFEHFAGHASLMDSQKCDEIDGYMVKDWDSLKKELLSLYTSSTEKKTYQSRDIQRFTVKKRKISKLIHFNTYRHEFQVITKSLESCKA